MRIYKLSLGTDFFDDAKYNLLKTKLLVSVHPNTKPKGQSKQSQGSSFLEAKKGDLFYICRSNQSVEFIGMFVDERPLYSTLKGHEDWTERSYELLFDAKHPRGYDPKLSKWWSPDDNSTFIQIPQSEFKSFEESILKPVFEVSLKELNNAQHGMLENTTIKINEYASLQQKFSIYKNDTKQLLDSVNALNQIELLKIQYTYKQRGEISHQPVVLLRSRLLEKRIEGIKITEALINTTKEEIATGFEKNVFHVWKDPFRILYTFLYDRYKKELVDFFNGFILGIQNELDLQDYTEFNFVHIDGAQNQGHDSIWFAIYNKTYSTHKLAKQLHLVIKDGFEYGLYDEITKKRDQLHKSNQLDYTHLIEVFKNHKEKILNDNSMEKARIGAYLDILEHKKQIILQGPPGTGKTYTAKKMARQMLGHEDSEQLKIIQFHPSYSYEDFVRGISAKSEGGNIIYESENKLLASLAEDALNNLNAVNKDVEELSREREIEILLAQFSEKVQDEIDENGSYKITDAVSIIIVEEDAFRYTGEWKTSQRMKFKDLVLAQLNGVNTRQGLKKLPGISGLARQHSSYFIKVLNQFQKVFQAELKKTFNKKIEKPELKNYVLIIDEINRANLPSVLGELIYALEYRNEAVESMYALDGDNSITIPENLYIIGTMNTADRSVGHIDYAIKRRFAFVDILPNADVINNEKSKELFQKVAALFVKDEKVNSDFLAPDFDYKDVQLGHSYFILQEGTEEDQQKELKLRLKYEILPILNEYVKDGLLLETAKEEIQKIANFEF